MKGRRTAAMLCVLLGHALVVFSLLNLRQPERPPESESLTTMLYFFEEDEHPETESELPEPTETTRLPTPALPPAAAEAVEAKPPGESAAITTQSFVDWPVEARHSATRVLAAEAEAERVAKLFAGPQGTWASLTKRQQSEISKFRWKPGVDGLERDEKGNTIYRLNSRCVLVNFVFIGCALGAKPPAYGDMFENMRLYFDEQRLPATKEGNGTEPESLRPPKWQKPLP